MRQPHASLITTAALLIFASPAYAGSNLVLNGDFEINGATAGASQVNLTNATFTALVHDTTAFGNSNDGWGELDLYTTDAGYVTPPQSGAWQVRLHSTGYMLYDAFSFWLSRPVPSGASYLLRFHVSGLPGINPNAPVSVEIGLSDNPTAFGTSLYTSQDLNGDGGWNMHEVSFVAPITASYLTVRNVSVSAGVDNFTLTPIPEPETWALLLAGLGLVSLKLRRAASID
ncbi:MAG: PEP-CTERM sorting domain-containing protein [Thiobacillaceae bacterium]|jgi:hypothetical protein|nr:PEP-CTERM sorting domain-containing protein [Thiobacillaceae bacterium]